MHEEAVQQVDGWIQANGQYTPKPAQVEDDENEHVWYEQKSLPHVGQMELHSIVKDVFIGIVTDLDYGDDKATRVLKDIHKEFNILFKGKLN